MSSSVDDIIIDLDVGEPPKPVNAQLYLNSVLKGSECEKLAKEDPDALHGARDPNLAIVHEKPEHRFIVYLKAQGFSNREISEKMGYTEPWVSQITRQPWFVKRVMELMREEGRDAVQEVIKASAGDSVITLLDIRDNPDAPCSVRAQVANSLLDRFLGRAVQSLNITREGGRARGEVLDAEKELEELRTREALLTQQLVGANG